ncbi:hypothetical protein D3C84_1202790 [compost metagenome]
MSGRKIGSNGGGQNIDLPQTEHALAGPAWRGIFDKVEAVVAILVQHADTAFPQTGRKGLQPGLHFSVAGRGWHRRYS